MLRWYWVLRWNQSSFRSRQIEGCHKVSNNAGTLKIVLYDNEMCLKWSWNGQIDTGYTGKLAVREMCFRAYSHGAFFLSATAFLNQITGDRSQTVWTVSLKSIQPIPCNIKNAVSIINKNAFQWDAYCPLLAHISQHALLLGGGGTWPGACTCPGGYLPWGVPA